VGSQTSGPGWASFRTSYGFPDASTAPFRLACSSPPKNCNARSPEASMPAMYGCTIAVNPWPTRLIAGLEMTVSSRRGDHPRYIAAMGPNVGLLPAFAGLRADDRSAVDVICPAPRYALSGESFGTWLTLRCGSLLRSGAAAR
jgi:hypothetical protein